MDTHLSNTDNEQNLSAHARQQENILIIERLLEQERDQKAGRSRVEEMMLEMARFHQERGLKGQELHEALMQHFIRHAMVNPREAFPDIAASLAKERASGKFDPQVEELHAIIDQSMPATFQGKARDKLTETLRIQAQFEATHPEGPSLKETLQEMVRDPDFKKNLIKYGGYGIMAAAVVSSGGAVLPVMAAQTVAKAAARKMAPLMGDLCSKIADRAGQAMVRHGLVSQETYDQTTQKLDRLAHKASKSKLSKYAKFAGFAAIGIATGAIAADSLTSSGMEILSSSSENWVSDTAIESGEAATSPDAAMSDPSTTADAHTPASEGVTPAGSETGQHAGGPDQERATGAFQESFEAQSESDVAQANDAGQHTGGPDQGRATGAFQESFEAQSERGDAQAADSGAITPDSIILEHTAVSGDTLSDVIYDLCRQQGIPVNTELLYGDGVSPGLVDKIAAYNSDIIDPDDIYVGQTIHLPMDILAGTEAQPPVVEVAPEAATLAQEQCLFPDAEIASQPDAVTPAQDDPVLASASQEGQTPPSESASPKSAQASPAFAETTPTGQEGQTPPPESASPKSAQASPAFAETTPTGQEGQTPPSESVSPDKAEPTTPATNGQHGSLWERMAQAPSDGLGADAIAGADTEEPPTQGFFASAWDRLKRATGFGSTTTATLASADTATQAAASVDAAPDTATQADPTTPMSEGASPQSGQHDTARVSSFNAWEPGTNRGGPVEGGATASARDSLREAASRIAEGQAATQADSSPADAAPAADPQRSFVQVNHSRSPGM